MKKNSKIINMVLLFSCAALIPLLFILYGLQADRYLSLQKEIKELETKQIKLVDENKKLITEISELSSSERISKIAENELGMHKAETDEIVRVEMMKKK